VRSDLAQDQSGDRAGYVTVNIYDQIYHLSGQNPEHIQRLAECVDAKMRSVAAHGRTVDSLRVAVLAALNLADELSRVAGQPKPKTEEVHQGQARAASLRGMLDEVLADGWKTGS